MLILAIVQTGNSHHQRRGSPVHVRITVIGTDGLAQHLVVVELHVERVLNLAHRPSCPYEEVIRTNTDHFQVVRFEELLDRFRLLRRRRKPRRNLRPVQEVTIVGRCAVVELLCQCVEFTAVMRVQPDTDLNDLRRLLRPEVLCRVYVSGCVVRDQPSACIRRQPHAYYERRDHDIQPNPRPTAGTHGWVRCFFCLIHFSSGVNFAENSSDKDECHRRAAEVRL